METNAGARSAPGRQGRPPVVLEEAGRPRRRRGARPAARQASPSACHSAGDGSMPVGLCGALTTATRVVGRNDADQALDVEGPAVGLAQLVEGDLGAGRARHLVEALVARPGDDGVVARARGARSGGRRSPPRRPRRRACRRPRAPRTGRRSRPGGAGRRAPPCSRAAGPPSARGPRRRRARGGRPSASPRRRRRTGGARRRTPSGRSSARGRSRRSAWPKDGTGACSASAGARHLRQARRSVRVAPARPRRPTPPAGIRAGRRRAASAARAGPGRRPARGRGRPTSRPPIVQGTVPRRRATASASSTAAPGGPSGRKARVGSSGPATATGPWSRSAVE